MEDEYILTRSNNWSMNGPRLAKRIGLTVFREPTLYHIEHVADRPNNCYILESCSCMFHLFSYHLINVRCIQDLT